MNPTQNIAAEAALDALSHQNPRFKLYREQDPTFRQADVDFWTREFQSAIEKAYEQGRDDEHALWMKPHYPSRAAHASEGKLYREIIPQPTTTQNNFGNAIELLTEPPIWVEPLHQPAHASEPSIWAAAHASEP